MATVLELPEKVVPKNLKDVMVDVTPRLDDEEIVWTISVKTTGYGNGNRVNLPEDAGYRIVFQLENPDQLDVRFDASDPIFVRSGGGSFCPTRLDSDQIMIDSCEADELAVYDWNFGDPQELHYQLNFVTETGKPVKPCDPIIDNGGGASKP